MKRWVWVLLSVTALGCDRFKRADDSPEAEAASYKCRQTCGEALRSCSKDCQNDAPHACDSRCNLQHQKCMDRCTSR